MCASSGISCPSSYTSGNTSKMSSRRLRVSSSETQPMHSPRARAAQFGSAVHESRKSVKKVRAVAALLKQAGAKLPRRDRRRLKSAARALSRVRDSCRDYRDVRSRSSALSRSSYPSTLTKFSAVAWSPPAIEAKRVRSTTASSPTQPSAWRRRVSRQKSGHPIQSNGRS